MKLNCPSCGGGIAAPDDAAGKQARCPLCRRCRKRWTLGLVVAYAFVLGGLFLIPLACGGAIAPFANRAEEGFWAGCGIGFLVWLVACIPAAIWIRRTRPFPKRITDQETTLKFPRPEATRQVLGGDL